LRFRYWVRRYVNRRRFIRELTKRRRYVRRAFKPLKFKRYKKRKIFKLFGGRRKKNKDKHLLKRVYKFIQYCIKVTCYNKNKDRILRKILSVGHSAAKFRYFRFMNRTFSSREKHFTWMRPKKTSKIIAL